MLKLFSIYFVCRCWSPLLKDIVSPLDSSFDIQESIICGGVVSCDGLFDLYAVILVQTYYKRDLH